MAIITPTPDETAAATAAEATAAIPGQVAELRATFDSGRTRPIEWRRGQLERLDALLVGYEQQFLDTLNAELGKSATEGYVTEIGFLHSEIAYAQKHLDEWTSHARRRVPLKLGGGKGYLVPDPLGVVLIIAPWNYPVQLALGPLVAAIAAGNTAIVKPSEVTPKTSALLARAIPEYLDPDAVKVVEGGVTETTALLEERFDHIFYTGNGKVGRIVMGAAAKNLTPVTLELGGKSPAIIDRSANVKIAARRIAWGKWLNTGQTCVAPDYVLVDEAVEQPFLSALVDAVTEFYGTDPKRSPDYGRIVDGRHFARLSAFLGDGTALIGGETDANDRYIAPTVLVGVDREAPVMQEEIFGPILPIFPMKDLRASIDMVNQGDKPLALYVFADDKSASDLVLRETTSGGACVNATLMHVASPELPFGGVGESGIGAYHGKEGFLTFSHDKAVFDRPTRPDPSLSYPPYTKLKSWLLRKLS